MGCCEDWVVSSFVNENVGAFFGVYSCVYVVMIMRERTDAYELNQAYK